MAYRGGEALDRTERRPASLADGTGPDVRPFTPRPPVGEWRRRSAFPEIDCIRDRLSLATVAAVERRALAIGVGADRVLIAAGIIDEDSYIMALAGWLGLPYESFDGCDRASCPLGDRELINAASTGLLPLIVNGQLALTLVPRSVRDFVDYVAAHPRVRFRLTSTARLKDFIVSRSSAMGNRAAEGLHRAWPHLSAAKPNQTLRIVIAAIVGLAGGVLFAFPTETKEVLGTVLTFCFMSWLALRLFGSCCKTSSAQRTRVPDDQLPVYTIIAALYREAEAVEGLIRSLQNLRNSTSNWSRKATILKHGRHSRASNRRLDSKSSLLPRKDRAPSRRPSMPHYRLPEAPSPLSTMLRIVRKPINCAGPRTCSSVKAPMSPACRRV